MMERLTKRIDGGIERVCHHYPEEEKMCYGCVKRTACNADLFDRLAYYEDTGLMPEEVKDMAENAETRLLTWFEAKYSMPVGKLMDLLNAHEQGRLVVPPCKVGDTVWVVNSLWVSEYTIKSVFWDDMFFQFKAENETYAEDCRYFSFFDERIGKTVFLTREEAEQALKGGAE